MSSQNDGDSFKNPPDPRLKLLLDKLKTRERDALLRFYCANETPLQIQRATGISEPDLRALRSRIRAEFRALPSPKQSP